MSFFEGDELPPDVSGAAAEDSLLTLLAPPELLEAEPLLAPLLVSFAGLASAPWAFGFKPYRSEYHPEPLSTKPMPPDTCRFAAAMPQDGQSVSGGSLMR